MADYIERPNRRRLEQRYGSESFGGVISSTDASQTISWFDSRQGTQNPHWREQVKADIQAGTFLTAQRYHIKSRPYAIEIEWVPNPPFLPNPLWTRYSNSSGHMNAFVPYAVANVTALDEVQANNMALVKFVNRVRRHQTSIQGGVVVGEIKKTIHVIKNPVMSLRKSIGSYLNQVNRLGRRARTLSPRGVSKALADTWLEYAFGWRPLLADIDDGVKTLADHLYNVDGLRKMATGFGKSESVIHGTPILVGVSGPQYFATPMYKSSVMVRYSGSVRAGSYAVDGLNRRIGFDATNWLPTAWELLPYSFLVDYFSNIGDVVNAASMASTSLRWTMKTVIKELRTELTNWQAPPLSPSTFLSPRYTYVVPGTHSVFRRTVDRQPYTGSLVPSLEFSIPDSAGKWLNITALLLAGRRAQRLFRR